MEFILVMFALAFLLVYAFTSWAIFKTLAKVCAVLVILDVVAKLLSKIFK